jgi:hypothetical protein
VSQRQGNRADDSLIPMIAGLVVLTVISPALLTAVNASLLPRIKSSGVAFVERASGWWSDNWWLVTFWLVGLATALVYRQWLRRQLRARTAQAELLATDLKSLMPRGWTAHEQLRVRQWKGTRPVLVHVGLTKGCPDTDEAWRSALSTVLTNKLGPLESLVWPTASARRRLVARACATAGSGRSSTREHSAHPAHI